MPVCRQIKGKRGGVKMGNSAETGYRNPLLPEAADPCVIRTTDGKYYLYPTHGKEGFKVWSSDDLVHWKDEGFAYRPTETSWARGNFWAPDVVEHNGKFYLYYTGALELKEGGQRIGVAVSDRPTGPFEEVLKEPLLNYGYAVIDAELLIDDDGRKYLYYAKDCSTNPVGGRKESHIYVVEMNDDLVSVKGEPVLLLRPDQEWEMHSGNVLWNEAPLVFKRKGTYYLLYSANFFGGRRYSVGYAVSASPLGPFVKSADNPILCAKDPQVSGPGHNDVALSPDGSEWFIVYHTHMDPQTGGGRRQVCIDRMGFRGDGSIFVDGPTITEQPMPSKDRRAAD